MLNGRYDLIIFEKFKAKGKHKYKPHRIGSVIHNKSNASYTIFIPEGISITGRVLMVPRKIAEAMPEDELLKAYKAAADDYGL